MSVEDGKCEWRMGVCECGGWECVSVEDGRVSVEDGRVSAEVAEDVRSRGGRLQKAAA